MDLLPSFISLLPPTNYLCSLVKESKNNSTDERQDAESQTYNDGKLPHIRGIGRIIERGEYIGKYEHEACAKFLDHAYFG